MLKGAIAAVARAFKAQEAVVPPAAVDGGSSRTPPRRGTAQMISAYNRSPMLRAATAKIAEAVGSTQWELRARAPDGQELEILGHPALAFLAAAPPGFTPSDLVELEELHLILAGESFSYVERNALGVPVRRWPILPTNVVSTPYAGSRVFRVRTPGGSEVSVPEEDVLWMRRIDPAKPYGRGVGSVEALADEVSADEAAAVHISSTLRNRAAPDMIISGSNDKFPLTKEIVEKMSRFWTERFTGPHRSGQPMFTSLPISVEKVSPTFKELELTKLRAFERDLIISALGIPPEILGVLQNSNRSTIDAAEFFFMKHTVLPRCRARMNFLNMRVAPMFDERLVFRFQSPVEEDREFGRSVVQAAPYAFSIDEIRELAGHEKLPEDAGTVSAMPAGQTFAQHPPVTEDVDPPDEVGRISLNGAQVQALQSIVANLVSGQIPEETAVALVMIAFPTIDEDAARALLGPAANFTPDPIEQPATDGKAQKNQDPVSRAVAAINDQRMADIIEPVMAEAFADFANDALERLEISFAFDVEDPRVSALIRDTAAERSKLIGGTTRKALGESLAEGVSAGESTDKLVKRIQSVVKDAGRTRAKTISRTEIVRTSNQAVTEAHREAGVTKRQWLATQDANVRDAHAALDGKVVTINDPFSVDGATAMFPGDFGVAELDINCRCAVIPVFEELEGKAREDRWKGVEELRGKHEGRMERRVASAFRIQAEEAIRALKE